MGKKINNYIEYQKRLKEFFSGIKEMPSSEEVQSFIDKYNLFIDWQIIILDVKKDISSLMLKNITGKSKSISSYKQYLVKLKESFGSLDEMPSRKQSEEFEELVTAPIYNGMSLKERWDNVVITEIEGICVEDWYKYMNHV